MLCDIVESVFKAEVVFCAAVKLAKKAEIVLSDVDE